jgi:predicted dehydrogenase
MSDPLRTVLVGFGRVAAGYAGDRRTARHYAYATHAQVLRDHPAFAWEGVIDPDAAARREARERWGIDLAVTDPAALLARCDPEVAVLAIPPEGRRGIVETLPSLRAVLVEKPLGRDLHEAEQLLAACRDRGILVQVNLWRRADRLTRELAGGRLHDLVGRPQVAFGVYGNGLRNNGTHMIDLARFLLGEVTEAEAIGPPESHDAPPGDVNVPLALRLKAGGNVILTPIGFEHYRENSLEIWGERGRLAIMNEGLCVECHRRSSNRALSGAWEIETDRPQRLQSTVGDAQYRVYDNLSDAIRTGADPWSSGVNALETARLVEQVLESVGLAEGAVAR